MSLVTRSKLPESVSYSMIEDPSALAPGVLKVSHRESWDQFSPTPHSALPC